MSSGTITLHGLGFGSDEERFESRVLVIREADESWALCFRTISARAGGGRLRAGDAGPGATPLSKSSIRRLRADGKFEDGRGEADREVVYVWADGIYVKAGLERDKAALLVDGRHA